MSDYTGRQGASGQGEEGPLSDLLLDDDSVEVESGVQTEGGAQAGGAREDQTPPAPSRDVYDDLIDDPTVRPAIREELRRRLLTQEQGGDQGGEPETIETPAQKVRREYEENRAWLDSFMQLPEEQRDYSEYAIRMRKGVDLGVSLADAISTQTRAEMNAGRSREVIDQWIADSIREEKAKYGSAEMESYADKVRSLASRLPQQVLADPATLRQQLKYYVEPNALKQHLEEQRARGGRSPGRAPRHSAGREAYMDGDRNPDDAADAAQNPYADASPEELRFLRGVGLVRGDEDSEGDGLVPVKGGYAIPIRPGRRNGQAQNRVRTDTNTPRGGRY